MEINLERNVINDNFLFFCDIILKEFNKIREKFWNDLFVEFIYYEKQIRRNYFHKSSSQEKSELKLKIEEESLKFSITISLKELNLIINNEEGNHIVYINNTQKENFFKTLKNSFISNKDQNEKKIILKSIILMFSLFFQNYRSFYKKKDKTLEKKYSEEIKDLINSYDKETAIFQEKIKNFFKAIEKEDKEKPINKKILTLFVSVIFIVLILIYKKII